jgi:hypothetical protein
VVLTVRVIPRAAREQVAGLHGDALKIRLPAPPVEGKANAALIRFLSDRLDVPANRVSILSGETGRNKRVLVRGAEAGAAQDLLS